MITLNSLISGIFKIQIGSSLAGKKEGVWGRNFCLQALLRWFGTLARMRPFGRSRERWRLASMLLFEIGSNFFIKAAPSLSRRRSKSSLFKSLEQVTGLEPVSSAWKAEVIALIRHLLVKFDSALE